MTLVQHRIFWLYELLSDCFKSALGATGLKCASLENVFTLKTDFYWIISPCKTKKFAFLNQLINSPVVNLRIYLSITVGEMSIYTFQSCWQSEESNTAVVQRKRAATVLPHTRWFFVLLLLLINECVMIQILVCLDI